MTSLFHHVISLLHLLDLRPVSLLLIRNCSHTYELRQDGGVSLTAIYWCPSLIPKAASENVQPVRQQTSTLWCLYTCICISIWFHFCTVTWSQLCAFSVWGTWICISNTSLLPNTGEINYIMSFIQKWTILINGHLHLLNITKYKRIPWQGSDCGTFEMVHQWWNTQSFLHGNRSSALTMC